jgi:hypothetical protein
MIFKEGYYDIGKVVGEDIIPTFSGECMLAVNKLIAVECDRSMITSVVKSIEPTEDGFLVTTTNSLYKLVRL